MCRRCSFFDHVYFSVGSFCDVSDKRKKKAFFRSVTDAWPFSPTSSAWSGALFCSWRESLTSICTFSCLRNSGCLRCQGKTALCLAQSSKLAGLKKKKKIEGYTECLDAGDMCEVGSDTVSVASVRTKSCDGQELEDHGPERV